MRLEFEAIALFNERKAIAVSYNFNAVFKVDIRSGAADYFGLVPNEEIKKKRLYMKAVKIGGKVYFVPFSAKEIAVYDITRDNIYKIGYEELVTKEKQLRSNNARFSGCVAYGKYLFITPAKYPSILRIDTTDDTIVAYDAWVTEKEYFFKKDVTVDGEYMYIPSCSNDLVLRFNMRECMGKLIHVGEHNKGCWSMCKVDEYFWLAPQNEGTIIRWNPKNGEIIEYGDYPNEFQGNGFLFTKAYSIERDVYFIPAYANMWVKISVDSGKMQKAEILDISNIKKTFFMFETEDFFYLKIVGDNVYNIQVNKKDNTVQMYEFWIDKGEEQFKEECMNTLIAMRDTVTECDYMSLEDFIEYLKK